MSEIESNKSLQSKKLLQAYMPIFALISALSVKKDFGDPGELATKLREKLNSIREILKNDDFDQDVIADAQYAVVAFVDESINRVGIEAWRQFPLATQMHLQANTGTRFFQKLDDWFKTQNPEITLLEIFYVCLGLGFKGEYYNQPEKLAELQRELLRKITGTYEYRDRLSPNGLSKGDDVILIDPDRFPWSWFISGAVGLLLFLFIVFKYFSNNQIDNIIEKLNF